MTFGAHRKIGARARNGQSFARRLPPVFVRLLVLAGLSLQGAASAVTSNAASGGFPRPLASYADADIPGIWDVLANRVRQEPFNLVVTLLFLGAVIHTFFTHNFIHWAHVVEDTYRERFRRGQAGTTQTLPSAAAEPTCIPARILHFLGEVEIIFGLWVIPLFVAMFVHLGWNPTVDYLDHRVSYIEPIFVVVIMVIASTRPVIRLAENCLRFLAEGGGGGPGAWWIAILTVGPVLGSLITEPAAMTISALLLGRQFYSLKPAPRLAYATLGLLFVNISVGGVLTHFAAPPVLMVAAPWRWNTPFMFMHFGWIAVVGIAIANAGYYLFFRESIKNLRAKQLSQPVGPAESTNNASVPAWVTAVHLAFMAWTVATAHHPALVIGGFLLFIGFSEVTRDYQSPLQLRSPLLVGFFLAGLVIHGGLQQWWIAPILRRLHEIPLMLGAIALTAFNDNAAVTYLATLVPDLGEGLKYAIVAGALTGGGLTVIANAPNPAGQSLLAKYFSEGISPLGLLLGALPATLIMAACFLVMH